MPRRTARFPLADDLGDDAVEGQPARATAHLAGFDARQLQHGFDDCLHLTAGVADGSPDGASPRPRSLVGDELAAQRDHRQRLLEIVHQHRGLIALERLDLAPGRGQLEQRPDARGQLVGAHRLPQILLGAELEARADRFRVEAQAGDQDDRQIGVAAAQARRVSKPSRPGIDTSSSISDGTRRSTASRADAVGGLAHAIAGVVEQLAERGRPSRRRRQPGSRRGPTAAWMASSARAIRFQEAAALLRVCCARRP